MRVIMPTGYAAGLREASPRLLFSVTRIRWHRVRIHLAGRGRPQSMRKHPGIGGGAPQAAEARWNALGDIPTISEKRELNDPRLENPTNMQTSVTVRLAERSRSLA